MTALAGCMVGPDYHRPATPAPSRFTEAPLPAGTEAGGGPAGGNQHFVAGGDAPGAWWTRFHSPRLSALVEAALRQNPSLEQAQQLLHQAQETTLAQEGAFLPQINGQFSRTRNELPGSLSGLPGFTETFSVYTAQLNVNYTFDVWGANRRNVEADRARETYQRFVLEGAIDMLAANTASTAITAASLAAQIAAEQQLLGAEQQLLKTVRAQFEAGGATGADVAQQQAQVANTEALLVPLETQLATARDQLAAYTGRVPAEAAIADISLDELSLPPDIPVSVPASLVDQRPDIRAAEAQLHAAVAAVGVAVAARLPQFSLAAFVGTDAVHLHQLFTPGNGAWSLLTQALAPIFQGGTLLHQQRAAVAAARGAAAAYQNTVITGFQNVADALTSLAHDGPLLAANEAAEAAARRSLDLAQMQYKLGGIAYLTVLTAETQYETAVINLIRARATRFSDTVALYTALGGFWWHRNDVAPPVPGFWRSFT